MKKLRLVLLILVIMVSTFIFSVNNSQIGPNPSKEAGAKHNSKTIKTDRNGEAVLELLSAKNVNKGVKLEFQFNKENATYLYRTDQDNQTQMLTQLSDKATNYLDSTATHSKSYTYYLENYKNTKKQQTSNKIEITFLKPPNITALSSVKNGIKISWESLSGVQSYEIFRKQERGSWQKVFSQNQYSTTFLDKNVEIGESYFYRVKSKTDSYSSEAQTYPTPLLYVSNKKVAYLTFDDGPSENTLSILKTLKKFEAKATFFVIGKAKLEYLDEIAKEGHTIGLHSYSHDYSKIYKSQKSYFEDIKKLDQEVYERTGIHSKIIRFPGGSSNSISQKYSNKIMTRLTKSVQEEGYRYFDWNLDSGDAVSHNIKAKNIVSNIKKTHYNKNNICILMHDSSKKSTTVKALPSVLKLLKKENYYFAPITQYTPQIHHKVQN